MKNIKIFLLLLWSGAAFSQDNANRHIKPSVTPIIIANSDTICIGNMALLYASGISGATYSWSNGATTDSIMVQPSLTTKYIVNISKGINTYKDSITVKVDTMPVVTFTGTHVCQGNTLHLTVHGGTKYKWWNGDTTASYPIVVAPYGDFIFTVEVWNGACSLVATGDVFVDTMPRIWMKGDTVVCLGDTTTIHLYDRLGGGDTYLWSGGSTTNSLTFSDNIPRSNDTLFTYHVAVYRGACTIDTTIRIRVLPLPCTLGIKKLSVVSSQLSVYPNPGKGIFTISLSHAELVSASQIEIYNVLGEQVYSTATPTHPPQIGGDISVSYNLNLSAQSNGVYFYMILKEDGSLVGKGKVVIQK